MLIKRGGVFKIVTQSKYDRVFKDRGYEIVEEPKKEVKKETKKETKKPKE